MCRVTEFRTDPDLADILVKRSFDTLKWMQSKGVRFAPIYGRQAFKLDGKFKFWGGLTLEAWGGGPGLVDSLVAAAESAGIEIVYEARALELQRDGGTRVTGVVVQAGEQQQTISAAAVILASGGFEANPEWRTRYLGPGWDLAKVRGSRFNMGDGIRMALDIGAMPWGHWSGAHAVGWDLNAPHYGDLAVGDGFQKHSYPFGIMVNAEGKRFVDEGADFRNYTYAKYGRQILDQPQQFAWQIFDQKVAFLLRDEYRIRQVTKVTADSISALAKKLDGRRPGPVRQDHRGVQRGGQDRGCLQPQREGRPPHSRPPDRQDELGQPTRHAAVRGLRRDVRPDVHLRWTAHHRTGRGTRHRRQPDSRPLRVR